MTPTIFAFEQFRLTVIEYKGEPVFLAREIGEALGYSREGGALVDAITRDWADELPGGSHVLRLEGEELAALKASLPADSAGSRTRHLVLLTERGLYRSLMLAGGPKATAFRDWLDGEVLPALRRTGTYRLSGVSTGALDAWFAAVPDELLDVPARSLLALARAELALGGAPNPDLRAGMLALAAERRNAARALTDRNDRLHAVERALRAQGLDVDVLLAGEAEALKDYREDVEDRVQSIRRAIRVDALRPARAWLRTIREAGPQYGAITNYLHAVAVLERLHGQTADLAEALDAVVGALRSVHAAALGLWLGLDDEVLRSRCAELAREVKAGEAAWAAFRAAARRTP